MNSTSSINITDLMGKMVVQLSCEEFCALTRFANEGVLPQASSVSPQAIGIHALAAELGCSASLLYAMKKQGVLDNSIVSHIGKKVVFCVDKARELANAWQEQQRENRHKK